MVAPAAFTQYGVNLARRSHVVGEGHAAPSATVDDAAVDSELASIPQRNDGARTLEEDDIVAGLGSCLPAEPLVEGARTLEVRDSQSDHAKALIHRLDRARQSAAIVYPRAELADRSPEQRGYLEPPVLETGDFRTLDERVRRTQRPPLGSWYAERPARPSRSGTHAETHLPSVTNVNILLPVFVTGSRCALFLLASW